MRKLNALQSCIALLVLAIFSVSAIAQTAPASGVAATYTITFNQGWNLVGNGSATPIDLATTFSDKAKVITVWAWDNINSVWAFYSPIFATPADLAIYAAGKNYHVLTNIPPGKGFWVNAAQPFAATIDGATSYSLGTPDLTNGWNLVSTGDVLTPAQLDTKLRNINKLGSPGFSTMWAWNANSSNWYFYAPNLLVYGTLASYIQNKGYMDFGTLTTGNGMGFGLNNPDIAPPVVLSTNPSPFSTGIYASSKISATFDEPMDASTLNNTTFTLTDVAGMAVAGKVTYSGTTALFTPANPLTPLTTYIATIAAGVKDLAGNRATGNFSWRFTTNAGVFMEYAYAITGSEPEAIAIGDVNGDGRNDVVMTTSTMMGSVNDHKLFVFLQSVSGELYAPVIYATNSTYTCRAVSVAIGDLNHDGKNDVAIGNSGCGIEVFAQNASGGLDPGVFYASRDSDKIRIADLNNDGLLDVVGVGFGTNTASIWFQSLSGTLNTPIAYSVTHGGFDDLAVGDVNNDGLTDIVVMSGQLSPSNLGILTQKSGGFSAPTYYSVGTNTSGVAVGDVNGDGLNDVTVTYGGNKPYAGIGIFLQNVRGTLDPVANYTSYDCPEPVVVADVTGDGRKDVITLHGGWNAMGVYQQNANGTLQAENLYELPPVFTTRFNPHGLAVGDINGDGKNDVVYADGIIGLVVFYRY